MPGQLLALLDEEWADFSAEARRRPVGEMVTRTMRSGKTLQFTRGAAVMQVTTHGMHHRAQCLNMLRQLGVTPLPASSVAEWTWTGEGRGWCIKLRFTRTARARGIRAVTARSPRSSFTLRRRFAFPATSRPQRPTIRRRGRRSSK